MRNMCAFTATFLLIVVFCICSYDVRIIYVLMGLRRNFLPGLRAVKSPETMSLATMLEYRGETLGISLRCILFNITFKQSLLTLKQPTGVHACDSRSLTGNINPAPKPDCKKASLSSSIPHEIPIREKNRRREMYWVNVKMTWTINEHGIMQLYVPFLYK